MCLGCWEEAGSPAIDNAKVREAAEAVREVYRFSCVGGNLHVIIDDWNIEDDWVNEPCFDTENVHEAGAKQLAAEKHCLGLLRAMTEDERASALAMHDGYFTPSGRPEPREERR